MADILIRGVEMPTKENLALLITLDGDVWRMAKMPCENKHLSHAKAIELPEHGDLKIRNGEVIIEQQDN